MGVAGESGGGLRPVVGGGVSVGRSGLIHSGWFMAARPPFGGDQKWGGPAAVVNAHRFIFASRDRGAAERLDILNDAEGVWRCRTVFNCTSACPRDIKITERIQEVKRALLTGAIDVEQEEPAGAAGG